MAGAGLPAPSAVQLSLALGTLLREFAALGFGTDRPIAGSDAVERLGTAFESALSALAGTALEPVVIHSPSESGFWSNDFGWTDLDEADLYVRVDGAGLPDLPLSTAMDAAFVTLSAARAADRLTAVPA